MNDLLQKLKFKPLPKEKKTINVIIKGIIIDESKTEIYDRENLLQKLIENKLLKVSKKPVLEITEKQIEPIKSAKKIKASSLIIEGEDEDDIPIIVSKKKERITKNVEKGIAILGPETSIEIGDTFLNRRLPKKLPIINIKSSTYYMNNREIFINFINSIFEPYHQDILENSENITCATIGKTNNDFSLLTHQKIVRDYINLYTPYRGLLLYHGLGSGKTCTSIAIAEGMKSTKKIIIMLPASLEENYKTQLKECGDLFYKKNQFWEWISTVDNPDIAKTISAILNLPLEYINKKKGAWFINITKRSNYSDIQQNSEHQISLNNQLNEMISQKYTFIHYNGLREKKLSELTNGYTKNLFDDSVVIIDEAHNLISRIVNKIKKESSKETKDKIPKFLVLKLYEYLLNARNTKIILLTGTPIINYPNEFGILFNILRGYIKSWEIPIDNQTTRKVDKNFFNEILLGEKTHDYLDYSPSSKILTLTRNPFGFKNINKKDIGYKGISNIKKDSSSFELLNLNDDFNSDEDFEKHIIQILKRSDINIIPNGIKITNKKALPDNFELFESQYIDPDTKKIKNTDSLKRRIIGLSSYFRSAQENLFPKYDKILGKDYHIVRIKMSDFQFKIYESARKKERKVEKKSKQPKKLGDLLKDTSSTYRIFSRLFCNFVMEDRPMPTIKHIKPKKTKLILKEGILIDVEVDEEKEEEKKEKEEKEETYKENEIVYYADDNIIKYKIIKKHKNNTYDIEQHCDEDEDSCFALQEFKNIKSSQLSKIENFKEKKTKEKKTKLLIDEDEDEDENDLNTFMINIEKKQDLNDPNEGEIEGDEILDKIGGTTYEEHIKEKIKYIKENGNDFLTKEALQIYSPKFLHLLENIDDEEHIGLHLIYSQFRTLEGVELFSLVLEKNGFARFKIKKNSSDIWEINIAEEDKGKPTYALYTGTESKDEKEILRKIYNGDWDDIPISISNELKEKYTNNNLGEVIKVFMITSSGSEGINLKNTRYVHIMEPYWHPTRLEQVIGRARRICSHTNLPIDLQTVEVFIYLMEFSKSQIDSNDAIELKAHDLDKLNPTGNNPITSDQLLYQISEIKGNLTAQLTDIIKQSAFDCNIYSNGNCFNFGDVQNDSFSYVPDYLKQQSDITTKINKTKLEWKGKLVTINSIEYVYRRIDKNTLNIYDKTSYEQALENSDISPIQVGTLETNEHGEQVFKSI